MDVDLLIEKLEALKKIQDEEEEEAAAKKARKEMLKKQASEAVKSDKGVVDGNKTNTNTAVLVEKMVEWEKITAGLAKSLAELQAHDP